MTIAASDALERARRVRLMAFDKAPGAHSVIRYFAARGIPASAPGIVLRRRTA